MMKDMAAKSRAFVGDYDTASLAKKLDRIIELLEAML